MLLSFFYSTSVNHVTIRFACGPGGEGEKQQHHGKSGEHCRVPVAERDTQVEIRFDIGGERASCQC